MCKLFTKFELCHSWDHIVQKVQTIEPCYVTVNATPYIHKYMFSSSPYVYTWVFEPSLDYDRSKANFSDIDSIRNNDYAMPVYLVTYYTIADLIPMGAQVISSRIAIIHFENEDSLTEGTSNSGLQSVIYTSSDENKVEFNKSGTNKSLEVIHQENTEEKSNLSINTQSFVE